MTTTAPKAPSFSMINPFLPLPEILTKNPFAAADPADVPENAPEGSYTYALVQSAPSVPAEECEVDAASVEIVIRWGASVLNVAHLTPPRSFVVGEAGDKDAHVDFALPAEKLGATRFPVVRKAADGSARVVIPAGAKGTATISGQVVKISDLAKSAQAEASTELAGAIEIPLRASTKARFEIGDVEFEVASVNAGRKVSGRFSFDRRGLPFQAISMAFHLGMLGAAAVFMPPMALASEDALSHDQIEGLKMVLNTTAEREQEAVKDDGQDVKGEREGGTGQAASGESGKMGSDASRATNGKWGAQGPKDNPEVRLSRESAIAMARDFGLAGLLNSGLGGDKNAPTVPWGGFDTLGRDSKSALGNMWGGDIGEANGGGGLGLTGVGEGAGGNGRGIGLGTVGTYGHGNGLGDGDGWGNGHGGSNFGRARHKAADLSMRQGKTEASGGHIPPEVIQRIVRQNFGRFRLCYENGLRNNPNLAGRVGVRFVIGRDGGVMSAANGGSDLPDAGVVSCVVGAFRGLQFPQSEEGGAVTVTYPISFAPAGK